MAGLAGRPFLVSHCHKAVGSSPLQMCDGQTPGRCFSYPVTCKCCLWLRWWTWSGAEGEAACKVLRTQERQCRAHRGHEYQAVGADVFQQNLTVAVIFNL